MGRHLCGILYIRILGQGVYLQNRMNWKYFKRCSQRFYTQIQFLKLKINNMDINKLFGYFSNDPIEDEVVKNLENHKNSPYFKIGMFKKLIINGSVFKSKVVSFFSKSEDNLDINDIDLAGEFMMYNRGWFWISNFKHEEEWLDDLKKLSDDELLVALKLSIHYFEEHEEYEKCAFLKKIQDTVQENLED